VLLLAASFPWWANADTFDFNGLDGLNIVNVPIGPLELVKHSPRRNPGPISSNKRIDWTVLHD
jgi:hypothetical protein